VNYAYDPAGPRGVIRLNEYLFEHWQIAMLYYFAVPDGPVQRNDGTAALLSGAVLPPSLPALHQRGFDRAATISTRIHSDYNVGSSA